MSIIDYFSFKDFEKLGQGQLQPEVVKSIESGRRTAKRYLFDQNASFHLGKLIQTEFQRIILNSSSALPPFEEVYLEYDATESARAQGKSVANGRRRHGILILHNEMYQFWLNADGLGPMISSFGVLYDQNSQAELTQSLCTESVQASQLRNFVLLGGKLRAEEEHWSAVTRQLPTFTVPNMPEGIDVDAFCAPYRIFEVWKLDSHFYTLIQGGMLIRRFAMLLLLNQFKETTIQQQALRRGIRLANGRSHVQHQFGLVSINLARTERLVLPCGQPTGIKHRRHEVRGHWAIRNTTDECDHEFYPVHGSDDRRLHCKLCPAIRYWRKAHERGDASLGIIHKQYRIHYDHASVAKPDH
jgi:hypothetical protein